MLTLQDQVALADWESKWLDPDYDMAPEPCPACGSIETSGGLCSWCHSEVEE